MNIAGKTIAIVGDSHMEALGPRLRTMLASKGARVVFVEARRGWSTARYAATGLRIPQADIVLIELGGNDRPTSRASYASSIRTVLSFVPSGARVIWIGPAIETRTDIDHDLVAELQRQIVPSLGAGWWDGRSMTRAADLRSDRLHFTSTGYDSWASKISNRLTGSIAPLIMAAGVTTLVVAIFVATVRGPQ